MVDVTRRSLLGMAAAGGGGLTAASVLSARVRAASFGNPDEPPQGVIADSRNFLANGSIAA